MATSGIGGLASSQETTPGGEPTPEATAILLGGQVSFCLGLVPEQIQGQENPTLALREGETYRLVWTNLDGVEHELIIEDEKGNELVATESATGIGATRAVTFTARLEMNQYYCEYHPQSMRGAVELGAGFTPTPGQTGTPTEGGETDGGY